MSVRKQCPASSSPRVGPLPSKRPDRCRHPPRANTLDGADPLETLRLQRRALERHDNSPATLFLEGFRHVPGPARPRRVPRLLGLSCTSEPLCRTSPASSGSFGLMPSSAPRPLPVIV